MTVTFGQLRDGIGTAASAGLIIRRPPVQTADRRGVTVTLPLTYLSRTGDQGPDTDVLTGRAMNPDLRKWTQMHPLDVRHETTDQMLGGVAQVLVLMHDR